MKFDLISKNKKIAGVILASALVIGGLSTIAAFAANSNDVVQKDTIVSVPVSSDLQKTSASTQGTIQYSKDVYSRVDGSQNFTSEKWYNPETKEYRSDYKEYNTNNQMTGYQSTYYVWGSNELISVQRDVNGNPVSGTITKREDRPALFDLYEAKKFDFDSIKSIFTGNLWTSAGTEQTPDGKTLNKLMQPSYRSYINDTTQANTQLIEYLDKDTGLPVKEELYEDSTGNYELFSTDTFEYKYVNDNGIIFKTDGITPISANRKGYAASK